MHSFHFLSTQLPLCTGVRPRTPPPHFRPQEPCSANQRLFLTLHVHCSLIHPLFRYVNLVLLFVLPLPALCVCVCSPFPFSLAHFLPQTVTLST